MSYSFNTREINISNPDLLEIQQVKIFCITGQEVETFQEIPTAKQFDLPLEKSLSSAVYIVKVYTKDQEFAAKVIIKR